MTFDSIRIGFNTLFSKPSWKEWAVVLTLALHAPAFAQERSASPSALEKQVIRIAGALPVAGGPTVPAVASQAPMSDGIWGRLAQAKWLTDGQAKAPRTVYVFTDPNCPYCNKFWSDARPWVDSGKVQLRHVIVGILTPTSPGKAAALLADKNPAQALDAYERGHAAETLKAMATGRLRPLDDAGMKPLASIPAAVQIQLDGNEKLMADLGLRATPAVVWKDDSGATQMLMGIPDSALAKVLGPR